MLIPSFSSYLSNIVCFIPGTFLLVFVCGLSVQHIRDVHFGREPKIDFSLVAPVLILGVIGVVCTLLVVTSSFRFFTLRFDPATVAEMQIERINRENEPALSATLILTDQQELAQGFQTLTTARFFVPNRETYFDGYRIRIRLQNEATYGSRTILVYQRAEPGNRSVAVVNILGFGSYRCSEFVEWIQRTIAPRFSSDPDKKHRYKNTRCHRKCSSPTRACSGRRFASSEIERFSASVSATM